MLLYEEAADERGFDALCDLVASKVEIHPEFVFLLHFVAAYDHVGAVVVTCGLGRIWAKVLAKYGLSKTVQVIGGGRVADGFVVTAAVKASLVSRLRVVHKTYVWAFRDSLLDLFMMSEADRAVVVVGPARGRSHASPRLGVAKLPLLQLHDPEFLQAVFDRRIRATGVRMLHATDKNAAKLLMTAIRDARI
ncbi:hypothetical protein PG994_015193 [Apiospora phragmitis]|uniref:Uncharacterized protein n=1 Tax=Apiospora phragmitis TaxID=2905665 RepID=A0ABR1SVS4_9PEZI